jgi:Copper transport outer membrane protein, MctB
VFDLRYHVASLAAVFIALVLGILVGVGISGRGLIKESERAVLQNQIDDLRNQRDAAQRQVAEQNALQEYERETYPAVMRNRLADRRVGVVYVGSAEGDVAAGVRETLSRAGAPAPRVRALKVPIVTGDLLRAVSGTPDAPKTVEDLGRALAAELVNEGPTPLWDAVGPSLVEEREGSGFSGLDGVVVARTADPQGGQTARFLSGFYSGLAAAGIPVVGVETIDDEPSAVPIYRRHGFSTVDNVETPMGRVALAVLLQGNESPGAYGVKDGVDAVMPNVEPVTTPQG